MTLNVAIVGPGRSKQGTGPYIARTFKNLGCNVQAIVSSSLNSANTASNFLENQYSIKCQTYQSLDELLKCHDIDVVAISSPADTHLDYLHTAIDENCNVFCEKPLWWPRDKVVTAKDVDALSIQANQLVKQCSNRAITLQLNTQWPFTLPAFFTLFPELKHGTSITNFSMWLSPQSEGDMMIVDTISHILSMLYTLLGAGKINDIESNFHQRSIKEELQIQFNYIHANGDTYVQVSLDPSDTFPKPAAYAINGYRVDRHVELPNYLISLQSSEKQVPVVDPLEYSIKNFIGSIHSKATLDEVALIDGITHLAQVYLAVTQP